MDTIYIGLTALLEFFPLIFLITFPFRKYLCFSFPITIFIIFIMAFFNIFIAIFSAQNGLYIFPSIFFLTILFFFYAYFMKLTIFQSLFILFMTKNYVNIIISLSRIAVLIDSFFNSETPLFFVFLLTQGVITFTTVIPISIFLSKHLNHFLTISLEHSFWNYLWIIPFSNYLIYYLGIQPFYTVTPSMCISLDIKFYLLSCIWAITTLLSCFITLKTLSETIENESLKKRLDISQMQILSQKEQYILMEKNIEDTKRLRHDLRHHLLIIKELLKTDITQDITPYLNEYIDTLEFEEKKSVCENYAVNAIVCHYISLAKKNNIEINTFINLPLHSFVPDSDLCVIFGNLLENAYDACLRQSSSEKRFIWLKATISGEHIITIIIKNSHDSKIRCKNNLFFSSKRPGVGIGIESVKRIASLYHGTSRFHYSDSIFTASILLNS